MISTILLGVIHRSILLDLHRSWPRAADPTTSDWSGLQVHGSTARGFIYLSFLNLLLAQYLKVWRSSFDDPRISGSSKSFHMCTSESDGSSGSLANFRTRTRSLVYPHPPLKRKCMWGQCLEDLSVNLQPESGECELAQWLMFISGTSNQSLEDVSLHCGLCSSPALSTRVWRT